MKKDRGGPHNQSDQSAPYWRKVLDMCAALWYDLCKSRFLAAAVSDFSVGQRRSLLLSRGFRLPLFPTFFLPQFKYRTKHLSAPTRDTYQIPPYEPNSYGDCVFKHCVFPPCRIVLLLRRLLCFFILRLSALTIRTFSPCFFMMHNTPRYTQA